jgi:hypothetical protein
MQTEQEIIAEIHTAIDTAQDRLLNEAKAILASGKHEKEIGLADRLMALGFISTPLAKLGFVKRKELEMTHEQAEIIEYHKRVYPFMKFLPESELQRICEKYSLVYAPVNRYIKEVPEKNLREIETAQELRPIDKSHNRFRFVVTEYAQECPEEIKKIIGQGIETECRQSMTDSDLLNYIAARGYAGNYIGRIFRRGQCETTSLEGLFIAAPESHFDLSGLDKKKNGFFVVTKQIIQNDPIVFRYVRGGVQVVSKWGLEANDEALIVPALN